MNIQDILSVKGSSVFTVPPEATLDDVVHALVEHRVGSLLVCRQNAAGEEELLGIITERDLVHASAAGKTPLSAVKVAEVMSTVLVTAALDDDVERIMGLMTTRRIRHLPVLVEGRLVGIISIGDVVKAQLDRLSMENEFMKDYITGKR